MDIVIPARGGSKRVPRKNLEYVGGVSLLANAIRAALGSRQRGRVVVTSDDQEMREVAMSEGAIVMSRPEHLATDDASAVDAVLDAARRLGDCQSVAMVLPNYPFTSSDLIDRVVHAWASDWGARAAVTARRLETRRLFAPWMAGRPPQGDVWESCGAVQVGSLDYVEKHGFHGPATIYFPVELWEAHEVDTDHDLIFARRLI